MNQQDSLTTESLRDNNEKASMEDDARADSESEYVSTQSKQENHDKNSDSNENKNTNLKEHSAETALECQEGCSEENKGVGLNPAPLSLKDDGEKKEESPHQQNNDHQTFENPRKTAASDNIVTAEPKRRRSLRNTNRISLKNCSSLQQRRLKELFFEESHSKPEEFTIKNLKLRMVSHAPNIYFIPNFLTESELVYLNLKIHNGRFQRSYVDEIHCETKADPSATGATGTLYDDSHRTSTFLSLLKSEDRKVQMIEQRASELLGYFSTGAVEPLQLVRYLPGQFFGVHHDLGDYNYETGEVVLPPKSSISKRRVVTIFVYLNEVKEGGATYFPTANVRVRPTQAGSAAMFCNVLENGQADPRTIHAGEPVGEGCVKYGLNIWLCEG